MRQITFGKASRSGLIPAERLFISCIGLGGPKQMRFCGFFGGFTLHHLHVFKKTNRCANILVQLYLRGTVLPSFAYCKSNRLLI
jgi:hypothetical protein